MERNFGGTAGNIAYNLVLLGEQPKIIASAGNDFESYNQWLKEHRVDVSGIQRISSITTASAYIMTDRADNQIAAFYPGAMRCHVTYNMKHVTQVLKKRSQLAIVAPGNIEDMKSLPLLYKKYGVSYIYDPGQNIPALSGQELRKGITGAKVFISNDYELALVLKKTQWTKAGVLVTTLGEKGSVN